MAAQIISLDDWRAARILRDEARYWDTETAMTLAGWADLYEERAKTGGGVQGPLPAIACLGLTDA